MNDINKEKIIIIDFGSQVTKLIARRVREIGVFSEVLTLNQLKKIRSFKKIKGLILSGGPATVTKKLFPKIPMHIFCKIPLKNNSSPIAGSIDSNTTLNKKLLKLFDIKPS